jgi:hypothetical protein
MILRSYLESLRQSPSLAFPEVPRARAAHLLQLSASEHGCLQALVAHQVGLLSRSSGATDCLDSLRSILTRLEQQQ